MAADSVRYVAFNNIVKAGRSKMRCFCMVYDACHPPINASTSLQKMLAVMFECPHSLLGWKTIG